MTTTTQNTTSILTADERLTLDANWRTQHRHAYASQLIVLAVLRGRNPASGFTPITRPTKLANGQKAWDALWSAQSSARRNLPNLIQQLLPSLSAARVAELVTAIAPALSFSPKGEV